MRHVMLVCCVLLALPIPARGQDDQAATTQPEAKAAPPKLAIEPPRSRWVTTLTNVQVELTLTDQSGTATPEKKSVSMIVSSQNWGKIRQTAARSGPFQVGLNVDARPWVSENGQIQLELTLYYYPPQSHAVNPVLPTELNQSLTVILQSGKPLLISQSADPTSDRKIAVEVKATILK